MCTQNRGIIFLNLIGSDQTNVVETNCKQNACNINVNFVFNNTVVLKFTTLLQKNKMKLEHTPSVIGYKLIYSYFQFVSTQFHEKFFQKYYTLRMRLTSFLRTKLFINLDLSH